MGKMQQFYYKKIDIRRLSNNKSHQRVPNRQENPYTRMEKVYNNFFVKFSDLVVVFCQRQCYNMDAIKNELHFCGGYMYGKDYL